jgi:hypothetical protein
MIAATAPQAISGVSAGKEAVIEEVYPSLAASGLGQFIGRLMDSIPVSVGGIKLSQLLFGPILAPFALLGYAKFKAFDPVYLLTNRAIKKRSPLGPRMHGEVALADIADITVRVRPGQDFYQAGDLELYSGKDELLMTLPGVPRPWRFRQIILDARAARLHSDASLNVIRARG